MLYGFEPNCTLRSLADVRPRSETNGVVIGGLITMILANATNHASTVKDKYIDAASVVATSVSSGSDSIKIVLATLTDRTAYLCTYSIKGSNSTLVSVVYIAEIVVLLNLTAAMESALTPSLKDVGPYIKLDEVLLLTQNTYSEPEDTISSLYRNNLYITTDKLTYLPVGSTILICQTAGKVRNGLRDLQVKKKAFIGESIKALSDLFCKSPAGLLDVKKLQSQLSQNVKAKEYFDNYTGYLRPAHIAVGLPLSEIHNTADIIEGFLNLPDSDIIGHRISADWFKRAHKQKLVLRKSETTTDGKYDVDIYNSQATIKYDGLAWKGARQDDLICAVKRHGSVAGLSYYTIAPKDNELVLQKARHRQSDISNNVNIINIIDTTIDINTSREITVQDFYNIHIVDAKARTNSNGYSSAEEYFAAVTVKELNFYYDTTICFRPDTALAKIAEQYCDFTTIDKSKATQILNTKLTAEDYLTMLTVLDGKLRTNYSSPYPPQIIAGWADTQERETDSSDIRAAKKAKDTAETNRLNAWFVTGILSTPHIIEYDNTVGDLKISVKVTLVGHRLKQKDFNHNKITIKLNGKALEGLAVQDEYIINQNSYSWVVRKHNFVWNARYNSFTRTDKLWFEFNKYSDFVFANDYLYMELLPDIVQREFRDRIAIVRKAIFGKILLDLNRDDCSFSSYYHYVLCTGRLSCMPSADRQVRLRKYVSYLGRLFLDYDTYRKMVDLETEYDKCLNNSIVTVRAPQVIDDDIEIDDDDLIEDDDLLIDEDDSFDEIELDDAGAEQTGETDEEIEIDGLDDDEVELVGDDAAWEYNRQLWLQTHPYEIYVEQDGAKIYWFDVMHDFLKSMAEQDGADIPYTNITLLQTAWQTNLKEAKEQGMTEEDLLRMMLDTDDGDDDTAEATHDESPVTVDDSDDIIETDDDLFGDL